jgi:hypothetical protein
MHVRQICQSKRRKNSNTLTFSPGQQPAMAANQCEMRYCRLTERGMTSRLGYVDLRSILPRLGYDHAPHRSELE